ncbi:hypothetical protein QAD02_013927 [Eretmocerus hayati]|uniref:Uncharacterized protein n=1 Tax=Eretmocerus hayati TaxID=131215 RepID=A0ACC2P431_9HYME|nr:hypothetical protein QAD02_013927 [Eretmocerus hayati]
MATEAEASTAEIHYVEITHIESRKNRIVPLHDVFQTTESTPQAIRNHEGRGSRQRFQRSVSPRQSPKTRASTTREIKREMLNSKKSQKIAVQKRSYEVLKDAMNVIPREVLKTFTDLHSSKGESSQEELTPRSRFSNSSEDIHGSSLPRAPTPGRPSVMIRPCSVQLEVMSSSLEISASKGSDTSADLPTDARFTCPSTSSVAGRSNLSNGVDSTVFNHLDTSANDIVHPSNRHVGDVAHSSLSCTVAEVVQCGVDIRSEVCEIKRHGLGIGGANQHGPVTTAQGEEQSPQGRELEQIYARQLELRLVHGNESARAESERIRELKRAQEEAKLLRDLERARARKEAERLREVERARAREEAERFQELERVRAREEAERLQELERKRTREEAVPYVNLEAEGSSLFLSMTCTIKRVDYIMQIAWLGCYRVVGTRIHLTQQQTVDILRWELVDKKNPKTFIWTTATIVLTHKELSTSALDPTQVKNVVPGHPRPRIINREKLLLLLSLYHDYVFGEHSVTTVKEREPILLKGCEHLSKFLWFYRNEAIKEIEEQIEGRDLDQP